MSVINELVEQIENPELRARVQHEVNKLNKQRKFGLVFEDHVPENTFLYDVPIKRGSLVAKRENGAKETFRVISLDGENALCEHTITHEQETITLDAISAVAQLGDPIYPYLKPMGEVKNAPDSELWHTLIEADNYHALQLLEYLYAGQVDCIYIDPPYNTGARDWKYNNDYVDENDLYRHSKWLSFIKKRLLLAKKLLNPNNSVLIITIDEKEYKHLGCILEDIFSEATIQMISSLINRHGTGRKNEFSRTNEFVFFVMLGNYEINSIDSAAYLSKGSGLHWHTLRRSTASNIRDAQHPNQFYPIYVDPITKRVVDVGMSLPFDVPISSVQPIENCVTVFPLREDGTEMMWSVVRDKFIDYLNKGYARVTKYTPEKPQKFVIQYLQAGVIKDIENGEIEITGRNPDGSIIGVYKSGKATIPSTLWTYGTHDARDYGTKILQTTIGDSRFDFAKSLYAVEDAIKLFCANKPKALILDFFAGSGTTLHAVNLLNAEDNGHRRCIMVTNNEIGETKEQELIPQGFHPGDDEWEKWGIARYVNWPRTECSIKGVDINGKPIEGEYLTSKTEIKQCERRFTQINFLSKDSVLKQKKALITFINKQKDIKLPKITEDADFLVADDDDSCNASILFDADALDNWKVALEGHDEITNLYVVATKDAQFRQIKTAVSELMGLIEESVPVKIPMSEGFKTNASYFKLGFLDKTSIALGRQFKELLPLLWMKAGARGECPTLSENELPSMMICTTNHFAVLIDETAFCEFEKEMRDKKGVIDTVFFVTDSNRGYKEMSISIGVDKTYQLYRDYLDNFRINNIK